MAWGSGCNRSAIFPPRTTGLQFPELRRSTQTNIISPMAPVRASSFIDCNYHELYTSQTGGVPPSPGAASAECQTAGENTEIRSRTAVAAPGDGRTPPPLAPPRNYCFNIFLHSCGFGGRAHVGRRRHQYVLEQSYQLGWRCSACCRR